MPYEQDQLSTIGTNRRLDELIDVAKTIAGRVGWICVWTFFGMVGSCSGFAG